MDWHEFAIGLLGVLTAMVSWVVTREVKRTDNLERRQALLVTTQQFEAHEAEDNKTFERMTEAHSRMQDTVTIGFKEVTSAINAVHVDMLQRALDHKGEQK